VKWLRLRHVLVVEEVRSGCSGWELRVESDGKGLRS
jgi:hypothetical protein